MKIYFIDLKIREFDQFLLNIGRFHPVITHWELKM